MGNRTGYVELDDLKRFLRQQEKKVKFSDSYRRLEWNSNNQGTIRLTGFSIDPSYAGHERFAVKFTDTTNFYLVGEEHGYLGVGDTLSTFISTGDAFTIESSKWTGEAQVDDEVSFETDSNISDIDALGFAKDSLKFTNGLLRDFYRDENIPFFDDDEEPLPAGIEHANLLYTAALIFEAAFIGQDLERSPTDGWVKRAENLIMKYAESIRTSGRPHWRSRVELVKKVGIAGVEDGEIEGASDDESYSR